MTPRILKRILYVEDETDIQAVAKLALEAVGGFEVEVPDPARLGTAAGNGPAARAGLG